MSTAITKLCHASVPANLLFFDICPFVKSVSNSVGRSCPCGGLSKIDIVTVNEKKGDFESPSIIIGCFCSLVNFIG